MTLKECETMSWIDSIFFASLLIYGALFLYVINNASVVPEMEDNRNMQKNEMKKEEYLI